MTRVLVTFGWERVRGLAERHDDVEFLAVEASGRLERSMDGGAGEGEIAGERDGGHREVGGDAGENGTAESGAAGSPEKSPTPSGEVLLTSPQGVDGLAEILSGGVRWVHVVGTGVDRFPMELLDDQILTCSRGASAVPISEWVMAHILAEAKRLPEAWITEKPKRWFFPQNPAATLVGQNLAIIGLGAIAAETAKRAMAFGMEVKALRRTDKPTPQPGIQITTSSEELVAEADCLLVACALTEETREMIDERMLAACKPGLHLLNAARGEIINERALRQALDSGIVERASLDTATDEPLPEGHWMFSHPKVRLTPHISWSEPGALERLLEDFHRNLTRWQNGDPLEGAVDLQAGY